MKRWVLFFSLFTLLVVGSFISYLYVWRAEFVSAALTRLYKTPAHVQSITYANGHITFNHVQLQNPPGCTIRTAFSAEKILIKASVKELLVALFDIRSAHLDEIVIVRPHFAVEVLDEEGKHNWKSLVHRLSREGKRSIGSRTFYVDHITLKDISLEVFDRSTNKPEIRDLPLCIDFASTDAPKSTEQLIHRIVTTSLGEIGKEIQQVHGLQKYARR